jgi:hypothetical protein
MFVMMFASAMVMFVMMAMAFIFSRTLFTMIAMVANLFYPLGHPGRVPNILEGSPLFKG